MHRVSHRSIVVLSLSLLLVANICAAQEPGRGRGMRGGMRGGLLRSSLFFSPRVETELKLTDDQKAKFREYFQEFGASFGVRLGQLFAQPQTEERDREIKELREKSMDLAKETDKKAYALLDEKQQKRFDELCLQLRGVGELATDAVAAKLSYTPEQKQQMTDLAAAHRKQLDELSQTIFRGGGADRNAQREEFQKKMTEINAKTDESALALLTDAQKEQLTKLKGEPLKTE